MKKGFTLIELLAVIVILAVIALIAVPVILSLVDKSRRKAAEESAILYVDTIENMLMINNIENTDGKTYKVKGRTVVDENDKVILNLEIKGDVPYSGVNNEIKINSGFIEIANLRFNSYYVHYEMDMTTKKFKTCTSQKVFLDTCDETGEIKPDIPDEPKIESGATIEIAKDKTYLAIIYLDPTDISKKCTKEEAEANLNEYGTPTMITNGCMKWYAYKEDDKNYIMILDHNTFVSVQWSANSPSAIEEGTGAKARLEKDTNAWQDFIKKTARFLTADEVAEITGANRADTLSWHSSREDVSWFYLDGRGTDYDRRTGWQAQVAKTTGSSRYDWLYNYTANCTNDSTTNNYGCSIADNNYYQLSEGSSTKEQTYGYWLGTRTQGISNYIYEINRLGQLMYASFNHSGYGIRPVITVPKKIFAEEGKPETPKEEEDIVPTELQIGQYVQMVPSKTEYSITGDMTGCTGTTITNTSCPFNQTINPSELTLWRVLRVNEDGTYDMVSDSISNEKIYLKGAIGSKKLIGTLNKIASQYTDNKYVVRTRAMGFNGQVEELDGFPSGLANPIGEAYGKGDMLYITDTDLVQSVYGSLRAHRVGENNVYRVYWLASRYHINGKHTNDLTGNYFDGRGVLASGDLGTLPLYAFDTSKSIEYAKGMHIRPIVTLSHKFAITGGNGAKDTPYILKRDRNS